MTICILLESPIDVDAAVTIPADTERLTESKRLLILKKINQCDSCGQHLDTLVIDTLLGFFSDDTTYIFPTLSPLASKMNPYYGKYTESKRIDDAVQLILLPLCDDSHFNGYIVDLPNRTIISLTLCSREKREEERSVPH